MEETSEGSCEKLDARKERALAAIKRIANRGSRAASGGNAHQQGAKDQLMLFQVGVRVRSRKK